MSSSLLCIQYFLQNFSYHRHGYGMCCLTHGRMLPVVYFNDNGSVASEGVREALQSFIADMEKGHHFQPVVLTEKTGLWDGSTHVLRPTDDVHQTQDCICMHDFTPSPGFDPSSTTHHLEDLITRMRVLGSKPIQCNRFCSILLTILHRNLSGLDNFPKPTKSFQNC